MHGGKIGHMRGREEGQIVAVERVHAEWSWEGRQMFCGGESACENNEGKEGRTNICSG